jgi:toxin ParE1/3/4
MTGYRLRERAKTDLGAIWHHTDKHWGAKQADRYYRDLLELFQELAIHPQLGRKRDEVMPGSRSFPQGRHVVFYLSIDSGVEIIGIPHQSEDVETHFALHK